MAQDVAEDGQDFSCHGHSASGLDPAIFVSVIIPHYNDLDGLALCLSLLGQQTWPRDRMEIIIADNNSACGLQAVRAVAPDGCRVICAPIQGAGPARNAGVAASRGHIYAFLDSDCQPAPAWIAEGVHALRPSISSADASIPVHATPQNRRRWKRGNSSSASTSNAISRSRDIADRETCSPAGMSSKALGVFAKAPPKTWIGLFARGQKATGWATRQTRSCSIPHGRNGVTSCTAGAASARSIMSSRGKNPTACCAGLAWTACMPFSIAPHILRILASDKLPGWRARMGATRVLIGHRLWRTFYMARLMLTPYRPSVE